MIKNKTLLPLLITLKSDEWPKWKDYCIAQCEKSSIAIKLVDMLYKHRSNLGAPKLHQKLAEAFLNQNQLSKTISGVFRITEDFMISDFYQNQKDEKQLLLNRLYNNRGLHTHANKCFQSFSKSLEAVGQVSYEDQELKYHFLKQQYYSDNPIKYNKSQDLFKSLIKEFKSFNSIQALIFYAESINWGAINKVDYIDEITYLRLLIQDSDTKVSLALNDLSKALDSLEIESYLKVVNWAKSEHIKDGSHVHTLLTMYLMRLAIVLWKTGEVTDPNIVADSISYGLKHDAYSTNGKIPTLRFLNIINTLGLLKSYEWQQTFIEKWSNKIQTNNAGSTEALAKALSAFVSKKYDQILLLLRGHEFDNYGEKSRAKKLELVALFEDRVNNYSNLKSAILSFKRFLKRHRGEASILEYKASINFAKILDALIIKDFAKKKINLDKYQPLTFKSYLTKKVNKA